MSYQQYKLIFTQELFLFTSNKFQIDLYCACRDVPCNISTNDLHILHKLF